MYIMEIIRRNIVKKCQPYSMHLPGFQKQIIVNWMEVKVSRFFEGVLLWMDYCL